MIVLFDLDNTIIDFIKFKKMSIDAAIYAMIDAGLSKNDAEKIRKEIGRIYKRKGMEYQKVFDEAMMKVIGKIDYKILASAVVAYRKVKAAYMNPYPRTIPTFKELIMRGYRLGILSDAPEFQMWQRLAELGLTDFFDFAISTDEFGKTKLYKETFLWFLKKIKEKPENVVMVGDSIDRDIYWPKKLGMKTILAEYGEAPWGKPKRKVEPNYRIKSISELLTILK